MTDHIARVREQAKSTFLRDDMSGHRAPKDQLAEAFAGGAAWLASRLTRGELENAIIGRTASKAADAILALLTVEEQR